MSRFLGWVKAPVIGSGVEDDPYRAKIADRDHADGDRLEFVIPTLASGTRKGQPRRKWALCAVDVADGSDLGVDPEVELLSDRALIRAVGKSLDATFDERVHLADSKKPASGSFVNDTFTDTSGLALASHTGETGGTWTEHGSYGTGDAVISDANRMRCATTNATCYYASGSPATAEYSVEAPLFAASVAGNTGPAGRIDTGANTMYSTRYNAGNWELLKFVAGVFTSLGTYTVGASAAATYTITLALLNATKKLYVDSVERVSSADNAITAAGKAGFRGTIGTNSTGWHFTSFTATDQLVVHTRSAALAATGSIASAGAFFSVLERTSALGATAGIASAYQRELLRSAALGATGAVEVAGAFFTTFERAAALDGAGAVTSAGLPVHIRSTAFAATPAIASTPQRDLLRSAVLGATGAIASAGQRDLLRSAAFDAVGAISSTSQRDLLRSVVLGSSADINATGQIEDGIVVHERTVVLGATAALGSDGHSILERAVALAATGAITSTATFWSILERVVAFGATGSLASEGIFWTTLERTIALSVTGDVTTAGRRDLLRTAALAAAGAIEAAGRRDFHRAAVLTAIAQIAVAGTNPTAWTYLAGDDWDYPAGDMTYDGGTGVTYNGGTTHSYDSEELFSYR